MRRLARAIFYASITAATCIGAPTVQAATVCPDTLSGHALGVVDMFSGPPADNYGLIPNQPGNRDIWPDLNKGGKPVFMVCRYQGTREVKQVQLPAGNQELHRYPRCGG